MYRYRVVRMSAGGASSVIETRKEKRPVDPSEMLSRYSSHVQSGSAVVVYDDPQKRTWSAPSAAVFYDNESDDFEFLVILSDIGPVR